MTIHVELMLTCDLKYDVPAQVLETLKYLTRKEDYDFDDIPDHPFFASDSDVAKYQPWRYTFQFPEYGLDFSYYPGTGMSEFRQVVWDTYKFFKLTLRLEVDSWYEVSEIYLPFLDWLAPYINTEEPGEMIGYFRGENTAVTHMPALIFCIDEKIYMSEAIYAPVEMNRANIQKFFCGYSIEEEE